MVAPISDYVSVRRALKDVFAQMADERGTETVDARDAYGRVSAEEVRSPVDMPQSTTSRMDGYAVRSADTALASEGNPVSLKIV
ncbi:MAG: hypothetical protein JRN64_04840, partial [Nitrososphaerota archaeon]|nr:hypothetical protein [Nitrososphaerota archaeon]